jgi:hypothetical protein
LTITRLPGLSFALVAVTAMWGCNPLTGADGVSTDSDDKETEEEEEAMREAPASPVISCAYPSEGNIGVSVEQIVPSNLSLCSDDNSPCWQGFGPGDTEPRDIPIAEFFDCDGSRLINGQPVNAILFDTSQFG